VAVVAEATTLALVETAAELDLLKYNLLSMKVM
jgi:hypothetical protein